MDRQTVYKTSPSSLLGATRTSQSRLKHQQAGFPMPLKFLPFLLLLLTPFYPPYSGSGFLLGFLTTTIKNPVACSSACPHPSLKHWGKQLVWEAGLRSFNTLQRRFTEDLVSLVLG